MNPRQAAMADDATRSRLGRGLATLIGDAGGIPQERPDQRRAPRRVPIEMIRPNPRNPRTQFNEAELDELAASIRERGIIQPVVVRAVPGEADHYEIIAGERRWRAAQRAGLHDVPVVTLEVSDTEALEIAIVENVQRADLNPLEEARGYQALVTDYGHSQDEVARIVGKSRSHVANTLRLLKLPEAVKAQLSSGVLSAGHARMLIGLPDAESVASDIVARGLNVRQVEALVRDRDSKAGAASKPRVVAGKDADTLALEKKISDALGLAVTIDDRSGKGRVEIRYTSLDQLDAVLKRLCN